MAKVILGLSGGVDSSLCAALLREEGHPVTGVFLSYAGADPEPARQAARQAGIELRVLDITEPLEKLVIEPFCAGYRRGVTPIPCVLCNPAVKFRLLLELADELGAEQVVTGHYARLRQLENGRVGLFPGPGSNDQSYMLHRLPGDWLPRLRFPLGEFPDKTAVREAAAARGLTAARRPDSMEICFIPGDDHAAFLEQRGVACPPGDFVDETGKVLGRHLGIHHYTVGQRRGLGVSASGRLFVRRIDPEKNQVVLTLEDPRAQSLTCRETVFQQPVENSFDARIRIRHSKVFYEGRVTLLEGNRARVDFAEPARAPAPGQSAVFYRADGLVLGGGYIE